MRTKIISHVIDESRVRKKQDVAADLKPSVMAKNAQQLENVLTYFNENINPFSSYLDKDRLFNISTGKAVADEVADFLLTAEKEGERHREAFIESCAKDEKRFESSITRNTIFNFSSSQKRKTAKIADKVVQVPYFIKFLFSK